MTGPKRARRFYAAICLKNLSQFAKRITYNQPRYRSALLVSATIAAMFFGGRGADSALAADLYVDDNDVTCGGNAPCFSTIQAAINAATAGDTINVFAGTYAEQIDVNKALTLLGPNANINPNNMARVAEAVIIPTSSDPIDPSFAGPIVVSFTASGVTFRGFTVDGDNPSLTSGVVYNGADVDAQFGVYGDGSANLDAVIEHNIVKNIGDISLWLNTFGIGGARNANSRMNANKVDNNLGPFGQGLRISDDAWADITNNVATRIRVGIVIENFSGNVTTHPASVIADNIVTSFRIGIRHNLHYVYSAPGFTIARNIVQSYVQSPMPPQVTTPTTYEGIRVESIQQTVAVTVENNTLIGNRSAMQTAGYTRDEGLEVTNASATSPNILFNRNDVRDFIRGAFHETPAVPTFTCNIFSSNTTGVEASAIATNGLIATNNNIAGIGFGMRNNGPATINAQSNWWGAANGPGPVGPGSGDNVSTNVDFSNWLTSVSGCANLATPGQLLISEFRLHGPQGPTDEFIEIYNNTLLPHTVSGVTGTGYSVAASDGTIRCVISNGTVIPARGHFLCVNSDGYSLGGYPSGNATLILVNPLQSRVAAKPIKGGKVKPLTRSEKEPKQSPAFVVLPAFSSAVGDSSYTADIPENAGIALFRTTVPSDLTLSNRIDAVGSTLETNALYKEGAGYPAITSLALEFSFVRDECGKGGSVLVFGQCPISTPKDTNDNAVDFLFVDTVGQNIGAGQRLGAPGPQDLASPIQRNAQMPLVLLDSSQPQASPPNRVRDLTSDTPNNAAFGTLDVRRRVINNTGTSVTRLRFRIIDLTTFPAPSGIADLRPRTSTTIVVSGINDSGTCLGGIQPCTVTVYGTTLEQPPGQPRGGGFNSSLSVDTVTLADPLPPGVSVNVRFVIGVMQPGSFRFLLNVEALP
jgi:hypothetical protein